MIHWNGSYFFSHFWIILKANYYCLDFVYSNHCYVSVTLNATNFPKSRLPIYKPNTAQESVIIGYYVKKLLWYSSSLQDHYPRSYLRNHGTEWLTDQIKMLETYALLNQLKYTTKSRGEAMGNMLWIRHKKGRRILLPELCKFIYPLSPLCCISILHWLCNFENQSWGLSKEFPQVEVNAYICSNQRGAERHICLTTGIIHQLAW